MRLFETVVIVDACRPDSSSCLRKFKYERCNLQPTAIFLLHLIGEVTVKPSRRHHFKANALQRSMMKDCTLVSDCRETMTDLNNSAHLQPHKPLHFDWKNSRGYHFKTTCNRYGISRQTIPAQLYSLPATYLELRPGRSIVDDGHPASGPLPYREIRSSQGAQPQTAASVCSHASVSTTTD